MSQAFLCITYIFLCLECPQLFGLQSLAQYWDYVAGFATCCLERQEFTLFPQLWINPASSHRRGKRVFAICNSFMIQDKKPCLITIITAALRPPFGNMPNSYFCHFPHLACPYIHLYSFHQEIALSSYIAICQCGCHFNYLCLHGLLLFVLFAAHHPRKYIHPLAQTLMLSVSLTQGAGLLGRQTVSKQIWELHCLVKS